MTRGKGWTILLPMVLALGSVDWASSQETSSEPASDGPVDIGSRRELFVDELLLGDLRGVQLKMHAPRKLRNPPQRPFGHYSTVVKDDDRFRLYYRGDKIPGLHWRDGWGRYHENEVTLYAESKDGFHWTEPNLGIHSIPAKPKGNVVLDGTTDTFLVTHNFSPFIDRRPGTPPEHRYKALGGGRYPVENWGGWKSSDERAKLRAKYGPGGLYAFVSADGLHWKKLQQKAVLTEDQGSFDSQNVSFWSEAEEKYVCYFRWMDRGFRSIRRATSPDFLHWSEPVNMKANVPDEHLYTSGTHPYYRAPHIYISLATRFMAKRGSITDVVFMSTRPGSDRYSRLFKQAFIRPGLGPGGWGNRSNYVVWGVTPTSDSEMSLYMYGGGHYTLRPDGFVSVHAGFNAGEFVTRPIVFTGRELEVNYATSAAGSIRVELQDGKTGAALPGFTLEESRVLYGDEIRRIVKWGDSTNVEALAGKPVRLRFVMQEADLYSLKFNP